MHLLSITDTAIKLSNSLQSTHAKKLHIHIFDIVDTAFNYERELIVCPFLLDFSKEKESRLQLICNAHTAFLLYGAESYGNLKKCDLFFLSCCCQLVLILKLI